MVAGIMWTYGSDIFSNNGKCLKMYFKPYYMKLKWNYIRNILPLGDSTHFTFKN